MKMLIVFMVMLVACGAEGRDVVGASIDPDIYEVGFRYLFERSAEEESATNATVYFIGLGAHAPDNDFMKRFAGHLPPVERRSEIKFVNDCPVDATTAKPGIVFQVDDEASYSNGIIKIKGGWYKGGLDAVDGTLFISRKTGEWRVDKYDLEYDSEALDTVTNSPISTNDIEQLKKFLSLANYVTFCVELDGREFTAYSLDEKSFDAKAMAEIKKESGLKIPADAKGMAFQYYPPIDPLTFAKIQIPESGREALEKQIKSFKDTDYHDDGFAYDRCNWWPPAKKSVFLFKRTYHNGYCMEIHLAKEKGHTVLYVQYFTI
jgi:hypothetical protein